MHLFVNLLQCSLFAYIILWFCEFPFELLVASYWLMKAINALNKTFDTCSCYVCRKVWFLLLLESVLQQRDFSVRVGGAVVYLLTFLSQRHSHMGWNMCMLSRAGDVCISPSLLAGFMRCSYLTGEEVAGDPSGSVGPRPGLGLGLSPAVGRASLGSSQLLETSWLKEVPDTFHSWS